MRVLLHCCCGPCSIMSVNMLRDAGHSVTAYFANPNIHPVSEYLRRREAMVEAAEKLDMPVIWQDDAYNLSGWLAEVHSRDIAANPNGARCAYCYATRLTLTAAAAHALGFEAFTTSLLYSRYQRHDLIRQEGEKAAALIAASLADSAASGIHPISTAPESPAGLTPPKPAPSFLYMDFRPGWQEGIDISKKWGLYRQNYCACIFSEEERFARKVRRLAESSTTLSL